MNKEKELNLSEKRQDYYNDFFYWEQDVKEFIKILIEELTDITKPIYKRDVQQIICKYAGNKLI